MTLPQSLREACERLAENYKLSDLQNISRDITQKYNSNTGGARLVTDDRQALVYSLVRMPATYCACYKALSLSLQLTGSDDFATMLDVGGGTGSACFAATSLLDIKNIDFVEREKCMSDIAVKLFEESGMPADVNVIGKDILKFVPEKNYDIVTASYALNELDEKSRERILSLLWEHTDKLLVIVEPGTPQAFEMQKKMRAFLRDKGANLIAPCPQKAECSLPQDDWCHFSCRVERSKLHRLIKSADSPFEDEKFTFSAFYKGDVKENGLRRVLRRPIIQPSQITLTLCSDKGYEVTTVRKKDKELFKKAKKADVGDLL